MQGNTDKKQLDEKITYEKASICRGLGLEGRMEVLKNNLPSRSMGWNAIVGSHVHSYFLWRLYSTRISNS